MTVDAKRRLVQIAFPLTAWVALATHAFLFAFSEEWKPLYNQGVTAMEGGDPRIAVQFFEKAASLRPNDPNLLLGLASAYFRSGKTQAGITTVHKLLSYPSPDFKVLMSAGRLLATGGRAEEAINTFKRAQKVAPLTIEGQSSSTYFDSLFAYLLAASQQNQRAVEHLQNVVKAEPDDPEARFRLVLMLVKSADFGRAYEEAKQALAKFPDDSETVLSYALTCYFTQHIEAAESAYRRLIEMEPSSDQAYFALGNFYSDLGKFDEAAREFAIAVSKDPKNYLDHYMYGTMLFRLNRIDEASSQFTTAQELNPSHADSCFWLGRILVRQGQVDDALAMFQKTVKLEPKHIAAYYQLGLLYSRKGEQKKSEEMFKIQNRLNADIHKGIIYERMP